MSTSPRPSRRTPPRERFASDEDRFDLRAVADALLREPDAGQHGHRQVALFRHGPATLALYCFEAGATLPDHVVDGPVIIHVLEGQISVDTEHAHHDLSAGTLLRLAPGIRHDVHATQPTQMLLTVCLEGPHSARV